MSQVVSSPAARRGRVLELGPAIDEFLASPDFAETTVVSYGRTLEALREDLGADVDAASVARPELKAHLESRYGHTAPATYNRHLAAVASLFGWLVDEDAIAVSPAAGLRRRKERITSQRERQDRALPYEELQARWRNPRHRLRDRTLWALAYSTAARADELLGLDVEDLDLRNRTAPILGKGGDIERIFWDSEPARLLQKLVADRRSGPVFLAERPPVPARMPAAADIDPHIGRAGSPTGAPRRSSPPPSTATPSTSSATAASPTSPRPARTPPCSGPRAATAPCAASSPTPTPPTGPSPRSPTATTPTAAGAAAHADPVPRRR